MMIKVQIVIIYKFFIFVSTIMCAMTAINTICLIDLLCIYLLWELAYQLEIIVCTKYLSSYKIPYNMSQLPIASFVRNYFLLIMWCFPPVTSRTWLSAVLRRSCSVWMRVTTRGTHHYTRVVWLGDYAWLSPCYSMALTSTSPHRTGQGKQI